MAFFRMNEQADKPHNRDRLVRELIDLVSSGRFQPGARLPTEMELAATHHSSRLTVREALSVLAGMGIIDQGRGGRRRIRKLDSGLFGRLFPLMVQMEQTRTLQDVFQIRLALETTAVRAAARRRPVEEMKAMQDNLTAHRRLLEANEGAIVQQRKVVVLDAEFHLLIARMSGNSILPLLMEAISRIIMEAQMQSCAGDPDRNRKTLEAHQRIGHYIEQGQAEAAEIELAHHLQSAAEFLINNNCTTTILDESP